MGDEPNAGNKSKCLLTEQCVLWQRLPDAFVYFRVEKNRLNQPLGFEILKINEVFADYFGLPPEDIPGTSIWTDQLACDKCGIDWLDIYKRAQAAAPNAINLKIHSPVLDKWFRLVAFCHDPGSCCVLLTDITQQRRSEEQLAMQIDFHNSLQNAIPNPVYYKDYQGRYLGCNKAFADFVGQDEKEIIGKTVFDLAPQKYARYYQQKDQELLRQPGLQSFEWVALRHDGVLRQMIFNRATLPDVDGRPAGLVGVLSDITERKEAEAALQVSEQKYRLIFESAPLGILHFDQEGRITDCNDSFVQIIGSSRQALIGLDMLRLPDKNIVRAVLKALQGELAAYEGDYRSVTADKTTPVRVKFAPLQLEKKGVVAGIGIVEDITEQKRAEETLRYQLSLQKLISRIAAVFVHQSLEQFDEGVHQILQLLGDFFKVDRVCVFQFSHDKQIVADVYEWCAPGVPPQRDKLTNLAVDDFSWLFEQLATKDHLYIPNLATIPLEAHKDYLEIKRSGVKSLICTPLYQGEQIFGFLSLENLVNEQKWDERQIELLKVVTDLTASALLKGQAAAKIQYLSFHDQLTGLYNRAYLEEEINRLDTERQLPFCILMADLNNLKVINDTYGHALGDEVLKVAAEVLKDSCRKEDLLARWGGDEFIILLPQTVSADASTIAQRILNEAKNRFIRDVPLSLAVGWACKISAQSKMQWILQEAEGRMYQHKHSVRRKSENEMVNALMRALAKRSYEDQSHIKRMLSVAEAVGTKLELDKSSFKRLRNLVALHDVGKVKIDADILLKPGKLTADEWNTVKEHPELGYRIARSTEEFSNIAEDIRAHHENWDGSGYPQGLKGPEIPLLARIVHIADAYEVMTSGRAYQQPLTLPEVQAEIKKGAGRQFDPKLAEIFSEILEENKALWPKSSMEKE